jgi:hypothetical protein
MRTIEVVVKLQLERVILGFSSKSLYGLIVYVSITSCNIMPSFDEKVRSIFADPERPRKFVTCSFRIKVFPNRMAMVSASRKSSDFVSSALSTASNMVYLTEEASEGDIDTTDQKKVLYLLNRLEVSPALSLTD